MKISDRNFIKGLLNIWTAASAASCDFFTNSLVIEETRLLRLFSGIGFHFLAAPTIFKAELIK